MLTEILYFRKFCKIGNIANFLFCDSRKKQTMTRWNEVDKNIEDPKNGRQVDKDRLKSY